MKLAHRRTCSTSSGAATPKNRKDATELVEVALGGSYRGEAMPIRKLRAANEEFVPGTL
jgi:hypothetical protein